MSRTLDEYLALPYHIRVVRDHWDDGREGWFAEVEELTGCMAQGESPAVVIANVYDAMVDWIRVGLEDGVAIPEPRGEDDYSGRFLLRIPRGLHAELARQAAEEGTSLNQFIAAALAGAVGWRGVRQGQLA